MSLGLGDVVRGWSFDVFYFGRDDAALIDR